MIPRQCGDCTLCCQAIAVTALQKPTGSMCEHACSGGCSVYANRPAECRTFRCVWLNGYFTEEDRPDRLGVVLHEEQNSDGVDLVVVTESSPGAARSERVQQLIRVILQRNIPVVIRNAEHAAIGYPDGRVLKFRIDPADPLRVRPLAPDVDAHEPPRDSTTTSEPSRDAEASL